jgi:hypothetical protein
MMKPCTNTNFLIAMIGNDCPKCGHSSLLHGGVHNPEVESCLACRLEAVLDDPPAMKKWDHEYNKVVHLGFSESYEYCGTCGNYSHD